MVEKIKDNWDRYISQLDKFLPFLIEQSPITKPSKFLEADITPKQYLSLGIVAKKKKIMISELSKSLGVALSTTTELVSRLEKKELIRKEKDSLDRRIIWVRATKRGLRIFKKFNIKRKEKIRAFLERLKDFEREALIRALASIFKIAQGLES